MLTTVLQVFFCNHLKLLKKNRVRRKWSIKPCRNLLFWMHITLYLKRDINDPLEIIEISEEFACVAPPKMISDRHMLRINFCDAGRQKRRHTETRKRVDIYKCEGYISFFLSLSFSLSFYIFLYLSFSLSISFSLPYFSGAARGRK